LYREKLVMEEDNPEHKLWWHTEGFHYDDKYCMHDCIVYVEYIQPFKITSLKGPPVYKGQHWGNTDRKLVPVIILLTATFLMNQAFCDSLWSPKTGGWPSDTG
jgi:hypothetical protein